MVADEPGQAGNLGEHHAALPGRLSCKRRLHDGTRQQLLPHRSCNSQPLLPHKRDVLQVLRQSRVSGEGAAGIPFLAQSCEPCYHYVGIFEAVQRVA